MACVLYNDKGIQWVDEQACEMGQGGQSLTLIEFLSWLTCAPNAMSLCSALGRPGAVSDAMTVLTLR